MNETKPLAGLWRENPESPEGKYLVKRRDGSVVEWPNFVIGAKDPAAPAALRAYAEAAQLLGMNARYVMDIRNMAEQFERYRSYYGDGDPDRGRHRVDDPATIAEMRRGQQSALDYLERTAAPPPVRPIEPHVCHRPGCGNPVPPRMVACRECWYLLPKDLRANVWKHYVPGQEILKNPTRAY